MVDWGVSVIAMQGAVGLTLTIAVLALIVRMILLMLFDILYISTIFLRALSMYFLNNI